MYLESFTLPIYQEEELLSKRASHNGEVYGYIDNPYPCGIFSQKDLSEICFKKITVFYGGNGSGKSTILNLIAQKLELNRIAPFNMSEMTESYVAACEYELGYDDEGFRHRIPDGSRIITSDDIFDYMLTVRTNNNEIGENKEEARADYDRLKYSESIRFSGLDDYEEFRLQVLARRRSVTRRKFIRRTAGEETELNSNGETALKYFKTKLKSEKLYLLDEPENSMSPKTQLELVDMISHLARLCDCQFIIATHSPFLLAMDNTKIYNLDAVPVISQNWWELESMKKYYEFFKKYSHLFENANSIF